jgi:heme/copper-type cytochrome/quinol oxidase subunit 4
MWIVYRLGAIAILIILLFLFFAEKTGRRYPIGYVLIVAIIGFILIVGVLAE